MADVCSDIEKCVDLFRTGNKTEASALAQKIDAIAVSRGWVSDKTYTQDLITSLVELA